MSLAERGRFLLEYIDLLLAEGVDESDGFRHHAPGATPTGTSPAPGRTFRRPGQRDRWVVNKLRALGSWYTKGFREGSRLRTAINHAESVAELRDVISEFFLGTTGRANAGPGAVA